MLVIPQVTGWAGKFVPSSEGVELKTVEEGGQPWENIPARGQQVFSFFSFLKRCWWSFFGRTTGENDHHHRFKKKTCSKLPGPRSGSAWVGPCMFKKGVAEVIQGRPLEVATGRRSRHARVAIDVSIHPRG